MNIIETPREEPVEATTNYNRVIWWRTPHPPPQSKPEVDILYRTASWLHAEMGDMRSNHRLYVNSGTYCQYAFVPDSTGGCTYREIGTFSTIGFDATWQTKSEQAYKLLPGYDGNLRYIGYDDGPGWVRWDLYWTFDGKPDTYCMIIDFDDASMALQCKLACS